MPNDPTSGIVYQKLFKKNFNLIEVKLLKIYFSFQDSKEFEAAIAAQRMKQKELIGQLKVQLEELENYAYEMGEAGLPQNVIMEKQKVIIGKVPHISPT